MEPKADIALIGLAVMGQNLILNMNDHGYRVAVFNRTVSKVDDFIRNEAAGTEERRLTEGEGGATRIQNRGATGGWTQGQDRLPMRMPPPGEGGDGGNGPDLRQYGGTGRG